MLEICKTCGKPICVEFSGLDQGYSCFGTLCNKCGASPKFGNPCECVSKKEELINLSRSEYERIKKHKNEVLLLKMQIEEELYVHELEVEKLKEQIEFLRWRLNDYYTINSNLIDNIKYLAKCISERKIYSSANKQVDNIVKKYT
jgi:hypothetical protein